MDEEKLRQLFQEIDPENKIASSKIDEIILSIKESERNPIKPGSVVNGMTFDVLQNKLELETDWRKKASIAAKIISLGLE